MRTKAFRQTAKNYDATGRAQRLHLSPARSLEFHDPAAPLLEVQRTRGNRYAQRLLRAKLIQARLNISQPNDPAELEAEQVAETVMTMPEPGHNSAAADDGLQIQRVCAHCEEDLLRQHEDDEEKEKLHARAAPDAGQPGREVKADLDVVPQGGQPLPDSARAFFEPRMGYDFEHVRIHADARATQSAKAVDALAYTVGSDVVFGAGQYAPDTPSGRRLLAHELAHVVQQTHSGPARLQRLGANPGCTAAERDIIRQSIFNARGWLNKAIPQLEASPLSNKVIASLARNFGPTYGVAANASLIVGRLRVAHHEISTIPFGCAGAADATCATLPCGYTPSAGAHTATVCSNVTLVAGTSAVYQAGCVLHESFHAAFSRFNVDEYSGWHGASGSTAGYPGTGVDPLLNADSYTTLVMDLS